MPHAPIQDVYLRSIYAFTIAGRTTEFTFVRASMPDAPPVTPQPAPTWAIISARNPMSRPLGETDNPKRDNQLLGLLADRGITHAPAEGRSPNGAWHEPSRLLLDLPRAEALELARRFDQHSIIWAQSGKVGLLNIRTEAWLVRTAFAVPAT